MLLLLDVCLLRGRHRDGRADAQANPRSGDMAAAKRRRHSVPLSPHRGERDRRRGVSLPRSGNGAAGGRSGPLFSGLRLIDRTARGDAADIGSSTSRPTKRGLRAWKRHFPGSTLASYGLLEPDSSIEEKPGNLRWRGFVHSEEERGCHDGVPRS
jgi:hypothetical protein